MSLIKSVRTYAIHTYMPFGIEFVFGLLIQSLLYRHASLDEIGRIAIIQVILVYGQALTDFGANTIAPRLRDGLNVDVTFMQMRLMASCVAITALTVISFFVEYLDQQIVILLSLSFLINAITPSWKYIASGNYSKFLNVQSISKILQFIAIFLLLKIGSELSAYYFFYSMFFYYLFICLYCNILGEKNLRNNLFSKISIPSRSLLTSCFMVTCSNISYNFARSMPLLILGLVGPLSSVAVFSACEKLLNAALQIRIPLFPQLVYRLNNVSKNNRYSAVNKYLLMAVISSLIIAIILTISSYFAIPLLFGGISGGDIQRLSLVYLPSFVTQFLLSFIMACVLPVLNAEKKLLWVTTANILLHAVLPACFFAYGGLHAFVVGILFADGVSVCFSILLVRQYRLK